MLDLGRFCLIGLLFVEIFLCVFLVDFLCLFLLPDVLRIVLLFRFCFYFF